MMEGILKQRLTPGFIIHYTGPRVVLFSGHQAEPENR